jgi:hypothetical protein
MRVGPGQRLLNGFKHLCTSFVGGPQGSAITNQAFPLTINAALKATEAKFKGVTVRAIQDDCDLMGDRTSSSAPAARSAPSNSSSTN